MHEDRAVCLDDQQPGRHREMGREPTGVVDLATSNHESHEIRPYDTPVGGEPHPRRDAPSESSRARLASMAGEFRTIGVVGLGTMGAGIAEVFARNGFDVIGVEQNAAAVERGRAHLEHSTGRALKRGKLSQAEQAGHLRPTDLDDRHG